MKLIGFVAAVLVCLLPVCLSEQLLHSVDGSVGRGNYTYYSLMYEGPITLYLYSTLGDADLYVSQVNSKPTFEPDTYCLQSSTCGLDTVHIPQDFSRPVGIGVYGHPSHEASAYLLEVYLTEPEHGETPVTPGEAHDPTGQRRPRARDPSPEDDYYAHDRRGSGSQDEEKEVEESFLWTLVWSFFDILVEILFL